MKKYKIGLVLESVASIRTWDKNLGLRNELLKRNDIQLFEIHKDKPKDYFEDDRVIQVFNKSIRELLSYLYQMDLVIAPDTGPMHAALSLNIPTICLFTHIDGSIRTNCYDPDIVYRIQGDCPQNKQCWYNVQCVEEKHNEARMTQCITSITVDQVIKKVDNILSKPNISYCIVYANDANISKCLNLIKENMKANEEVVVVNNGCKSYKEDKIKPLFDKYQYIENKDNLGCIIARNQAMKAAKGTYIVTLDDDQFISPYTIHSLQSINADIVGTEAWSMDENFMASRLDGKKQLAYVGGGGLIVKKKVLEDIGYLDERYAPAWFSDSDLCFAAKDKGYIIDYHPNPGIIHLAHQTVFNQKDFDSSKQWKKSHELFTQKWSNKEIESIIDYLFTCDPATFKSLDKQLISKTLKHPPEITLAMLSWKRLSKLFASLDNYVENSYLPVNLILRVQGSEDLTDEIKKKIEGKCKKFKSYKLFFTKTNEGTGKPRKWLSEQILKYYPDTKYFNFTDDDMIYKKYATDVAIILLEQLEKYDSMNISWKDKGIRLSNPNKLNQHHLFKLSPGVNDIDMCGSATQFMRIGILEKCKVDDNYVIGLWDHDFHLQMYTQGLKMGIYKNDKLNCKNDHSGYAEGKYKDYKAMRRNKKIINNSRRYFKKKWGQNWKVEEK